MAVVTLESAFHKRGWFLFAPFAGSDARDAIKEPSSSSSSAIRVPVLSEAIRRSVPNSRSSDNLYTAINLDNALKSVILPGCKQFRYAGVKYVLEQALDTKIFSRFSGALTDGYRSALKVCPATPIGSQATEPTPIQFTTVNKLVNGELTPTYFWDYLHELGHVALSTSKLRTFFSDAQSSTDFGSEYSTWLVSQNAESLPVPAAIDNRQDSELGAQCFALFALSALGLPTINNFAIDVRRVNRLSQNHGLGDFQIASDESDEADQVRSTERSVTSLAVDFFELLDEKVIGFGDISSANSKSQMPFLAGSMRDALGRSARYSSARRVVQSAWHAALHVASGVRQESFVELRESLERCMTSSPLGYRNVSLHTVPTDANGEIELEVTPFAAAFASSDEEVPRDYTRLIFSVPVPAGDPASWNDSVQLRVVSKFLQLFVAWDSGSLEDQINAAVGEAKSRGVKNRTPIDLRLADHVLVSDDQILSFATRVVAMHASPISLSGVSLEHVRELPRASGLLNSTDSKAESRFLTREAMRLRKTLAGKGTFSWNLGAPRQPYDDRTGIWRSRFLASVR